MKTKSLHVSALWHSQVHQSPISCIAPSNDNSIIYTAADTAAPTLKPSQPQDPSSTPSSGGSSIIIATDPSTGSPLLSSPTTSSSLLKTPRSLIINTQTNTDTNSPLIHCITGQGPILSFNQDLVLLSHPEKGQQQHAPPPPSPLSTSAHEYIQKCISSPPTFTSAVYDPEKKLLFTSSVLDNKDTSIKVWQVEDINNEENEKSAHSTTPPSPPPPSTYSRMALTLIHTLHGHTAAVLSLTLLDSHLLFSGSYDQTIRIWDLSTWSCIQTLKGHGGGVKALALSPPAHSCSSSNSRTLFSAGADNTIRAWGSIDARRRQGRGGDETRTIEKAAATTTTTPSYRHQERWICLRTLHGRHEDLTWPICLAVSDDGKFLASGSTGPFGGATIKIFYIGGDDDTDGHGGENGECLATFAPLRFDQKGAVNALLFSHSDNEVLVLYSGCSDGSLAAWKLTWKEDGLQRQGLKKGFF